jgi:hypothetical protein
VLLTFREFLPRARGYSRTYPFLLFVPACSVAVNSALVRIEKTRRVESWSLPWQLGIRDGDLQSGNRNVEPTLLGVVYCDLQDTSMSSVNSNYSCGFCLQLTVLQSFFQSEKHLPGHFAQCRSIGDDRRLHDPHSRITVLFGSAAIRGGRPEFPE